MNQLNAQIKITEMWKATNDTNYPLKFDSKISNNSAMISRSKSVGKLPAKHGSYSLKATFKNDGVMVWNQTPDTIKECNSLEIARKCIKTFF